MNVDFLQGGNVIGVGIDMVEIARIRASCERHEERFLERIFTQGERVYCLDMKNPHPHLAARFAAKEAVSKAFGTGIGEALGWKSIEVVRDDNGKPLVRLDAQGQGLLERMGAREVLLSLSHTMELAIAIAVLIK